MKLNYGDFCDAHRDFVESAWAKRDSSVENIPSRPTSRPEDLVPRGRFEVEFEYTRRKEMSCTTCPSWWTSSNWMLKRWAKHDSSSPENDYLGKTQISAPTSLP